MGLQREKQTLLDELTTYKDCASDAHKMDHNAAVEALQIENEQFRAEHEKLRAQLAEKEAEIEALRAADKAIEIDIVDDEDLRVRCPLIAKDDDRLEYDALDGAHPKYWFGRAHVFLICFFCVPIVILCVKSLSRV